MELRPDGVEGGTQRYRREGRALKGHLTGELGGRERTCVAVFFCEHMHHIDTSMNELVSMKEPQRSQDLNQLSHEEPFPSGGVYVLHFFLPDHLEVALIMWQHDVTALWAGSSRFSFSGFAQSVFDHWEQLKEGQALF